LGENSCQGEDSRGGGKKVKRKGKRPQPNKDLEKEKRQGTKGQGGEI